MAKGNGGQKAPGSQVDPSVVALAHAYLTSGGIRKAVNARVHAEINPQLHQVNRDIKTRTQQGDSLATADQSIYGAVAQKYAALSPAGDTSSFGNYAKELAGAMAARGAQEGGFAKAAASQDVVGLQGKRSDLRQRAAQLRTQYTSDLNQQNFTNTVTAETLLGKQAIQEGMLGVSRQNAKTAASRAATAQEVADNTNTNAQNANATTQRGQDLTHTAAEDAINERRFAAQLKKTGHLTPTQVAKLGDAFSGALEYAGVEVNKAGGKRHTNAQKLLQQILAGSPGTHTTTSSIDPKTGSTVSSGVTQAGTKWPALIAAAAAEETLYGGLTGQTIRRLHKRYPGFAVKGYGKVRGYVQQPLS